MLTCVFLTQFIVSHMTPSSQSAVCPSYPTHFRRDNYHIDDDIEHLVYPIPQILNFDFIYWLLCVITPATLHKPVLNIITYLLL